MMTVRELINELMDLAKNNLVVFSRKDEDGYWVHQEITTVKELPGSSTVELSA